MSDDDAIDKMFEEEGLGKRYGTSAWVPPERKTGRTKIGRAKNKRIVKLREEGKSIHAISCEMNMDASEVSRRLHEERTKENRWDKPRLNRRPSGRPRTRR